VHGYLTIQRVKKDKINLANQNEGRQYRIDVTWQTFSWGLEGKVGIFIIMPFACCSTVFTILVILWRASSMIIICDPILFMTLACHNLLCCIAASQFLRFFRTFFVAAYFTFSQILRQFFEGFLAHLLILHI
jgi:hypothetical protein